MSRTTMRSFCRCGTAVIVAFVLSLVSQVLANENAERDVPACTVTLDANNASKTIQDAVEQASAGTVICVPTSNFQEERVHITQSGTKEAPIHIRALGHVQTAGFVVEADHIVIDGFTVSNRGKGTELGRGHGIYLLGTGLRISNNTVIDSEQSGIGCEQYGGICSDVVISDNTVRGANGTGILVAGEHILVEGNDVAESVMIDATDADGIRFFGSNIVIRDNYVHDIFDDGHPPGEEPHTDCFQTFDNDKLPSRDVLIEANYCDNVDHQCLIVEAPQKGETANITFRRNICRNNGSQGVLLRDVASVEITDNLFLSSIEWFGVKIETNASHTTIRNNVFVGRFQAYWVDESSTEGLEIDQNIIYDPSAAKTPSWWHEPNGVWGGGVSRSG